MNSAEFWFSCLLFLYGGALGSFYQTTADRLLKYFYSKERKNYPGIQKWKVLFLKPSACEVCEKKVSRIALIPIFGYFWAKGKCQACSAKLSFVFPASELLFGLVAVASFHLTESIGFALMFPFLLGHLWISIHTDSKHFSLDYENLPFILAFGLLSNYFLLGEWIGLKDIYVFVGFFLVYLSLYFLFKKGMGLGDVFFAPCFALIAGHPFWMFYLNASYTLALVVTILLRKKGESLRKKPIPMGVYLSLGLFLSFIAKILFFQFQLGGYQFESE